MKLTLNALLSFVKSLSIAAAGFFVSNILLTPVFAVDTLDIAWTNSCVQGSIAFSPDGAKVALVRGSVEVRSTGNGALLQSIPGSFGGIGSLAFSPNNLRLAAGDGDGKVYAWNVFDGHLVWQKRVAGDVTSVRFTPTGDLASWSSDRLNVEFWRQDSGDSLYTFENFQWSHHNVAFSPDGQFAALGGNDPDYEIKIVRLKDWSAAATLKGHTGRVRTVEFSSDGKLLVSGADDSTIRIWNLATTNLARTIPSLDGEAIWKVDVAPNGTLIGVSWSGGLGLWRLSDGKLLASYSLPAGNVNSVTFSPKGDLIACALATEIIIARSPAPAITVQPAGQTRFCGQPIQFSVQATGKGSLQYQWQFQGTDLPGETNSSLAIASVGFSNMGSYRARVWNEVNEVISSEAELLILATGTGPGSPDPTFPGKSQAGPETGHSSVSATLLQPDGKLLIAGDFSSVNGVRCPGMFRLNPDYSLDSSFNIRFGSDGAINAMALLPDGKILVGGTFSLMDCRKHSGLARLNPDGSLDSSFTVEADSPAPEISAINFDGTNIWLGGRFSIVGGQPRTNVACLSAEGILKPEFVPCADISGMYDSVTWICPLSDGKVLVGGHFEHPTSTANSIKNLVRLNADGSLDSTFDCELTGLFLASAAVRPDRSMIAAGLLHSWSGGSHYFALAELDSAGHITREIPPDAIDHLVSSVLIQPDGRILISGTFTKVWNEPRCGIARLNTDGSLDQGFDPGAAFEVSPENGGPSDLVLQPDGRIWVNARENATVSANRTLTLLNPNGSRCTNLALVFSDTPDAITTMSFDRRGGLLIGGFTSFGGKPVTGVGRLTPGGDLDASFSGSIPKGLNVLQTLCQPDGKIILGGRLDWDTNNPATALLRLNPDGSPDPGFQVISNRESFSYVRCFAQQPDGKLVVGGEFNLPQRALIRLNIDGTIDSTFTPPDLPAWDDEGVHAITILSSGKILIGGSGLSEMTPAVPGALARLNANGSLDTTYTPVVSNAVHTIAPANGGRWLIGDYSSEMGKMRIYVLDSNGDLEKTVYLSSPEFLQTWPIAMEPDGDILASGFDRIFRFKQDGSLDPTFDLRLNYRSAVQTMLVTPNGWLYIAGTFNRVNNIPAPGIARVYTIPAARIPFVERHVGAGTQVKLIAQPAPGIGSYQVEESVPMDTIRDISDGGRYDAASGKVVFGPFAGSQPRNLSYTVFPPPGAQGQIWFRGNASADGFITPVLGDNSLRLWEFYPSTGCLDFRWRPISQTMVLQLMGPSDLYVLETSTDLKSWDTVTTLTNANGFCEFLSVGGPDAKRFYRTVRMKAQ